MTDKFKIGYLYLTLFISGAVILIIEIAGTRVLSPFYGSTIFVWSSLIAVTLGFLALGYFAGGFIADKHPKGTWFYSIIFLGGAVSLFLIKFSQPVLVFSDWFGFRAGPLIAVFILFALPIFFLSMAGPFAIRLLSRDLNHTGHIAGFVFGISTVGSLTGALLAGFYLLNNFLILTIFTGAAVLIMLMAFAGLLQKKASKTLVIVAAAIFVMVLAMPVIQYKEESVISIIHHEPSFYADLKVGDVGNNRCLFMNGIAQTCISLLSGVDKARFMGEIGRLSKSWPEGSKVLLMGLGGGGLVKQLDVNGKFALDVVELEPKIAELAKDMFGLKLDGNDTLYVQDARIFLRKTNKKYDLIISDLYFGNTLPIHLYTKEMSELIFEHLSENGVLIANISGKPGDPLASALVRTYESVFPRVLVATDKPNEFSNMLVQATRDPNYNPDHSSVFNIVEFDTKNTPVITDARNPLDILLAQTAKNFSENAKKVFGYNPLFAL